MFSSLLFLSFNCQIELIGRQLKIIMIINIILLNDLLTILLPVLTVPITIRLTSSSIFVPRMPLITGLSTSFLVTRMTSLFAVAGMTVFFPITRMTTAFVVTIVSSFFVVTRLFSFFTVMRVSSVQRAARFFTVHGPTTDRLSAHGYC